MVIFEKNGFSTIDAESMASFIPYHLIKGKLTSTPSGLVPIGSVKYDWDGHLLDSMPGVSNGGYIVIREDSVELIYTSSYGFYIVRDKEFVTNNADKIRGFDWHLLSPVQYESSYGAAMLKSRPNSYLPTKEGVLFSFVGKFDSPYLPSFTKAVLSRYSVLAIFGNSLETTGCTLYPATRKAALSFFLNPELTRYSVSCKDYGFIKSKAGYNSAEQFARGTPSVSFDFCKQFAAPPTEIFELNGSLSLLSLKKFDTEESVPEHFMSAISVDRDWEDLDKEILFDSSNSYLVLSTDKAIKDFARQRDKKILELRNKFKESALQTISACCAELLEALEAFVKDQEATIERNYTDGDRVVDNSVIPLTLQPKIATKMSRAFEPLSNVDPTNLKTMAKSLDMVSSKVAVRDGAVTLTKDAVESLITKLNASLSEITDAVASLNTELKYPNSNEALSSYKEINRKATFLFWTLYDETRPGFGRDSSIDENGQLTYNSSNALKRSQGGLGDVDARAHVCGYNLRNLKVNSAGEIKGLLNVKFRANPIAVISPDSLSRVDGDKKKVLLSICKRVFGSVPGIETNSLQLFQTGIAPVEEDNVAEDKYTIGDVKFQGTIYAVKGYNWCRYTPDYIYEMNVPFTSSVSLGNGGIALATQLEEQQEAVTQKAIIAWTIQYVMDNNIRNINPVMCYGTDLYADYTSFLSGLGIKVDQDSLNALADLIESVNDETFQSQTALFTSRLRSFSPAKEAPWVLFSEKALFSAEGVKDIRLLPIYWHY